LVHGAKSFEEAQTTETRHTNVRDHQIDALALYRGQSLQTITCFGYVDASLHQCAPNEAPDQWLVVDYHGVRPAAVSNVSLESFFRHRGSHYRA